MNTLFFYIILFYLNLRSLTNVSERNMLKIEAQKAFTQKKYNISIEKYQNLTTLSFTLEPESRMNLAHSYFNINDTTNALNEYSKLLRVSDEKISSNALIQIGVIDTMLGDSAKALNLFKEALKKNYENKIARYNFELLSKKMPSKPPQTNNNQVNQNEEQNQTKEELKNEGQTIKSDEKKEDLSSQTPEKMSKEKALQILEAMKTTELQNSLQRKLGNKSKDKNTKDW